MVIAVSYHETGDKLQEFASLAREPFDRPEWFALLEKHGAVPLIVAAESKAGTGALALMRENGRLAALRNWFSFTWRPLVPDGAQGDMLLRAMARDLKTRAHCVDLVPLPDEDGSASRLRRAFQEAGWIAHLEVCDENHTLPVRGRSFEDYWAGRPGRMRTTLKRKAKKVEVEILTRFDEKTWAAYRQVYQDSWKPEEEQAVLLEDFARQEGKAGRLRLGLARHEGEPVAAQFWTVDGSTAYIHKLAHIEAAKPLSAGTTLSAAMFEHAIDRDRVELIDFGTGADAYKRDWMEDVRPRYRLICLDPRNPRAWPALAKLVLRRLATAVGRR